MTDALVPGAVVRLVDAYCAVWNEPDPVRRQENLDAIWAADATYTDPRVHTVGAQALVAHIESLRAGRPGARIVRTSVVDVHHRVFRFGWRLVLADGTMLPEGVDFGELSDEMKLQRIVGFFGLLAPLPEALG